MPHEFDLILFDLDDTLAKTSMLQSFRGVSNLNRVDDEYLVDLHSAMAEHGISPLWGKDLLLSLQASGVQLGVVTNAPRSYAHTVLEQTYPDIHWDSVVSFEDVRQHKPNPDPILASMKACRISDRHGVAYIGDGRDDLLSAFSAGVSAVLFRGGWAGPREPSRIAKIDSIPDADLESADGLLPFLQWPGAELPPLERIPPTRKGQFSSVLRADSPYWGTYQPPHGGSTTRVLCLGRYFPKEFTPKSTFHRFTREILRFKDDLTFPRHWPEVLANLLQDLAEEDQEATLATIIPSKPGNSPRLESFFDAIKQRLTANPSGIKRIAHDESVFEFLHGSSSAAQAHLSRIERFEHLQISLRVRSPQSIIGKHIIVLDDVVTSGASLLTASRLLCEAGARTVTPVALARTISKISLG